MHAPESIFHDFESSTSEAASGEVILSSNSLRVDLDEDGTIHRVAVLRDGQWQVVGFRRDQYAGPKWTLADEGEQRPVHLKRKTGQIYQGSENGIDFRLAYGLTDEGLAVTATIHNGGQASFSPERASVMLGLDTAQTKYPEWRQVYFPTLLRCESTHFWGYFMNPDGQILAIGSPDPVASWHHCYNRGGHLIFTTALDLLNHGPLPERHPQNLSELKPGETRSWVIHLRAVVRLADVKPVFSKLIGAPMIEADRYTVEAGRPVHLKLYTSSPCRLEAIGRDGVVAPVAIRPAGERVFEAIFTPDQRPGVYTLRCTSGTGKSSEAKLSVRHPWSWYLNRAREEAINKPQKASTHMESWLGLYSASLAKAHFPGAARDGLMEAKFEEVFPLMYPSTSIAMAKMAEDGRIQNHACMAGLLAARYRAGGDPNDLELASSLVDVLITFQTADGAYRSGGKALESIGIVNGIHYTCVAYCAKSIMEVMAEEQKLAENNPAWKARYERHYESVKRAIDELALNLDNIQTEGEMTFEDGMISCSYAQLALFALHQSEPTIRQKYLEAALFMKNGHRSLSQLLIPDSRMNGGSLRFWEAQYDVLMKPNMLNSPHGWSAWRIYGLWYLYLLTGEEEHLRQVENALGACAQLIDGDSGELRWAFIPDPYIRAKVFMPDPEQPGEGHHVDRIIGECYVPMISGWHRAPPHQITGGYSGRGGCCDNDVHEVFKCLEEVALTSAYVLERSDGSIATWNCKVEAIHGAVRIIPVESCVSRIHLNLRMPHMVEARFADGQVVTRTEQGMTWIGPGAKNFGFVS